MVIEFHKYDIVVFIYLLQIKDFDSIFVIIIDKEVSSIEDKIYIFTVLLNLNFSNLHSTLF